MRANVGDRLVIRSHHVGEPIRDAEILEVRGEDGGPPFRVQWSDNGHETLVFPGADAFVEHLGPDPRRRRHRSPRRRHRTNRHPSSRPHTRRRYHDDTDEAHP
jgi:hypothetical protein